MSHVYVCIRAGVSHWVVRLYANQERTYPFDAPEYQLNGLDIALIHKLHARVLDLQTQVRESTVSRHLCVCVSLYLCRLCLQMDVPCCLSQRLCIVP